MIEPTKQSSVVEGIWEQGWEGHEQAQLERMAKLSFADKLAWLEEAHRLVQQIQAARLSADESSKK
jgi:hypothetical protein